jgi:hypothetical protein
MEKYYTYAYLREDRTPYYIGKGKGRRVYKKGRGEVNPPKDKSRIIFLKQNLTEEEAFKHEIYMIAVFGRKDLGTGILHNKTDGGDGVSGYEHSEETKRKLSISRSGENNPLYGKSRSKETRRKISEGHKGKTLPKEIKRKISEAQKGKTHSQETRRKISEGHKGKTVSEETRRKISISKSGENNPFYGKSLSEETKRKISEARKGLKWWNDGCGNTKLSKECPGEGWILGRGTRKI